MTYALVQITKLLSVALSLRSSLKCLKGLSSTSSNVGLKDERSTDQLMYWVVFALLSMYETYLEFLFRWIPLYFYVKLAFILSISFPVLRITNLIFWDFHVVIINRLYKLLNDGNSRTLYEIALDAPFLVLLLAFPALGDKIDESTIEKHVTAALRPDDLQHAEKILDGDQEGDELNLKVKYLNCDLEVDCYRSSTLDEEFRVEGPFSPNPDSAEMISTPKVSRSRSTTAELLPLVVSPRSLKEAKQDTLRRLSSLTSVIRCLTPKASSPMPGRWDSPLPPSSTVSSANPNRVSYRTRSTKGPPVNPFAVTDDEDNMQGGRHREGGRGRSPITAAELSPPGDSRSPLLRVRRFPETGQKVPGVNRSPEISKASYSNDSSPKLRFRSIVPSRHTDADGTERDAVSASAKNSLSSSKTSTIRANVGSLFDFDLTHIPLNSAARRKRRTTLGLPS